MRLRDTLLLLRMPYGINLMPVFFFAFTFADYIDVEKFVQVFLAFFLLIAPASYGYNSYMDADITPVGGLRHPPKPTSELWWICMLFNAGGIGYVYFLDSVLGLLLAVYVAVSIGYSSKNIKLKKFPIIGALLVIIFQGMYLYVMVFLFCQKVDYLEALVQVNLMIPAAISSLLVAINLPLTQVYQHKVDAAKGEGSLSLLFGKRGTFEFVGLLYLIVLVWMGIFLVGSDQSHLFYLFLCCLFPIFIFLIWWAKKLWADPSQATYRYTKIYLNVYVVSMFLYFLFVYLLKVIPEIPV
ncbi:MAG: UbiA family prenyltransferase [bacterium]|nr:UbiA family prenyltransferase [bacterium]